MAKKGTASVASGVRAPGAAPIAEPNAAPAEPDEPGPGPGASAAAAEADPARLSLDALSLGTDSSLDRALPATSGGVPVDAVGAEAGAGARGAFPGGAVPADAYGNPAGAPGYDASASPRFEGSPGMYPQMGTPGMPPGMLNPGLMTPEMAASMQQHHAAMLYHQQSLDPAAVYAYYRAAAESGDAARAAAGGPAGVSSADGSAVTDHQSAALDAETDTAENTARMHMSTMDPSGLGQFSAEMYAAQMHQLAQMGAHHPMHAHAPAYGQMGAHSTGLPWGSHGEALARHQQWQQHAGYAHAWGAHDAGAGAGAGGAGAYGNPYGAAYEGEASKTSRWKPPSPRGARGRRENGRNGGSVAGRAARGNGSHGLGGTPSSSASYRTGFANGWNSNLHGSAYENGDVRRGGGGFSARGFNARGARDRGDANPASALLEAFKRGLKSRETSRPVALSLADVAGHVSEFARDQHGSRFIQQRLEIANADEIAAALEEILPETTELAADVFGNYVAQKFFERGDAAARAKLCARLQGHVLKLSLHAYGCRVVQKALETVDEEAKAALALELDGNVLRCARDQNGNHVVQKCVERVSVSRLGFIVSALAGNVASLSAHPYGCRVIQRALERCAPYCPPPDAEGDEKEKNTDAAAEANASAEASCRFSTLEILRDAGALARDQYGNYVVQHVLQHGDDVSRKSVLATLAGQIVPLAQHKFASNVVEKCLTYCGAEEREIMIGEILGDSRVRARVGSGSQSADREENEGHASGSGSDATASDATASDDARRDSPLDAPAAPAPPLRAMMKDQFANYVVQKLLEVCDDDQRERLLASARAHLQAVKKVSYGKYIVARVEKLVVAAEASGARGGGGPSADAGADDAPGERRFAGEGGGESGG